VHTSPAPPLKKEPSEIRATTTGKSNAALKSQRKIKKTFVRLGELKEVEEEKVQSFIIQTLSEIKEEFGETIYFFDLLWLVASEIKDLMEAQKDSPMMAGLAAKLRNIWIRFAPGDLSRSGKAFWGMNNEDWFRLRNNV
jgi:hypothetical protein